MNGQKKIIATLRPARRDGCHAAPPIGVARIPEPVTPGKGADGLASMPLAARQARWFWCQGGASKDPMLQSTCNANVCRAGGCWLYRDDRRKPFRFPRRIENTYLAADVVALQWPTTKQRLGDSTPMKKNSTGPFLVPVDGLQVSFLVPVELKKSPQVSFLVPVGRFSDVHRYRFWTTPTLPPIHAKKLHQKEAQNSGRPHELDKSKRQAPGKVTAPCHALSRSVTKSLNTHGTVSECDCNANAYRTQQNANDRSTPVQHVFSREHDACTTRDALVTRRALQIAPSQHQPCLVQFQYKPLASPLEGLSKPFGKRFPNDSRNIASATDKIGNNVISGRFNVHPTLSTHQAMLQAFRKTHWVILGSRWVSIGFWRCA